jgi:hypothetical protein
MKKLTNEYPEQIRGYVNTFFEKEFFLTVLKEEGIREQIAFDLICKVCFDKFIKGDNIDLDIDTLEKTLKKSMVKSIMEGLKDRGLIDAVIDEKDEDIYFPTPIGKILIEKLKSDDEVMEIVNKIKNEDGKM